MKIKLFGFLFVCVLEMAVDMRAFGQCCSCDANDGCELGADNIGALDSPDCQPANCNNNDCSYCDENPENPPDDGGSGGSTGICPGYGDCDGVPSIYLRPNPGYCRCKSFNNVNCDGQSVSGWHICSATSSGEQYYDIFNESGYHFEGDVCYSNARDCKKFNVNVTGASGAWTCKKDYQTGTANWISDGNGKWDVSDCKCNKYDLNIPADGCETGVVFHTRNINVIKYGNDKIDYVQTRRYCRECAAGKVPTFSDGTANYGGVIVAHRPQSDNGDWGVWKCGTVSAPYYATGCEIDFTKQNSNDALNACRDQCDNHLTITTNGATGPNACSPDATVYADSTGEFTLGPDKCN